MDTHGTVQVRASTRWSFPAMSDHNGSVEWLQCILAQPETLSCCSVSTGSTTLAKGRLPYFGLVEDPGIGHRRQLGGRPHRLPGRQGPVLHREFREARQRSSSALCRSVPARCFPRWHRVAAGREVRNKQGAGIRIASRRFI